MISLKFINIFDSLCVSVFEELSEIISIGLVLDYLEFCANSEYD